MDVDELEQLVVAKVRSFVVNGLLLTRLQDQEVREAFHLVLCDEAFIVALDHAEFECFLSQNLRVSL